MAVSKDKSVKKSSAKKSSAKKKKQSSKKKTSGRASRKSPIANEPQTIREEAMQETNEISQQHPKVVTRLLDLAQQAREDLGERDRAGMNVRPVGVVKNPVPQVRQ